MATSYGTQSFYEVGPLGKVFFNGRRLILNISLDQNHLGVNKKLSKKNAYLKFGRSMEGNLIRNWEGLWKNSEYIVM